MTRSRRSEIGRFLALLLVAFAALEAWFALRVAAMAIVDPQSTTFQRSEAWRLATGGHAWTWQQRWQDDAHIAGSLKRAVIASEDAGFIEHGGVEWDALEKAWNRNAKAAVAAGRVASVPGRPPRVAKVVGGSTITQQLAKNVFLSGERNFVRKAQELVIAYEMEALLGKRRILEIYLNSVEWGEGVFGAQAAARRYFGVDAGALGDAQAARLAVMLPAPKRFEKRPGSPYVSSRAATIAARMGDVDLPR